jgi:pyruvate kinase
VVTQQADRTTQAISLTAVRLADQVGAVAVACLTHTGTTARAIARHRPDVPIYAFTDDANALGRISLTWGTEAIEVPLQTTTDAGLRSVRESLLAAGHVRPGDRVVVTAGLPLVAVGLTNMVHVMTIGEGD